MSLPLDPLIDAQTKARPRPTLAGNIQIMDATVNESEPQPSTSAETIRHLPLHLALPNRTSHTSRPGTPSQPSSPRSSIPSPSSPSGDSVSSLPSVSSSFLFSSGPGSPPHPAHHSGNDSEHEHGDSSLIIPSLTLPSSLRGPTPYGQAIGDVRLLVLGRKGHGAADIADVFADAECEDIVDVGQWEMLAFGDGNLLPRKSPARVLKVSTDWIEHSDAHGLEKHEPRRNLEIIHLGEYEVDDDPAELIGESLACIHSPFHTMLSIVHPEQPPSDLLATLLSSSTSPLYTAMVIASSQPLSPSEHTLITELSAHIPLIIFPPLSTSFASRDPHIYARRHSSQVHSDVMHTSGIPIKARLSSVQPASVHALREIIFRRPEALATLRLEAADRFLRWREVERAVGRILSPSAEAHQSQSTSQQTTRHNPLSGSRRYAHWDKAQWEAAWEDTLSTDVSKTLRTRRGVERRSTAIDYFTPDTPMARSSAYQHPQKDTGQISRPRKTSYSQRDITRPLSFDPLHLPSLLAFSVSLLAPLRTKIAAAFGFRSFTAPATSDDDSDDDAGSNDVQYATGSVKSGWALAGAFCAGMGVGIMLARMGTR